MEWFLSNTKLKTYQVPKYSRNWYHLLIEAAWNELTNYWELFLFRRLTEYIGKEH